MCVSGWVGGCVCARVRVQQTHRLYIVCIKKIWIGIYFNWNDARFLWRILSDISPKSSQHLIGFVQKCCELDIRVRQFYIWHVDIHRLIRLACIKRLFPYLLSAHIRQFRFNGDFKQTHALAHEQYRARLKRAQKLLAERETLNWFVNSMDEKSYEYCLNTTKKQQKIHKEATLPHTFCKRVLEFPWIGAD